MNKKQTGNSPADKKQLMLAGETNAADKGVLFCDLLMIGIFTWNQLRYGMDMLFLIIPLALIGVWIAVFALIPEDYRFAESDLEIIHKFQKTQKISYERVFNYDAKSRDSFINILRRNTVKVYYYTSKEKKRVVICHPRDVETFVEALRERCPEFHKEEHNSSLQVFFDHRDNKGD